MLQDASKLTLVQDPVQSAPPRNSQPPSSFVTSARADVAINVTAKDNNAAAIFFMTGSPQ
jgi:hypothetical protein